MSFFGQSHKILWCALTGLIMVAMAIPVNAEFGIPEVELTLSDTTVSAGDSIAWISVYFRNFQDTLAGFSMYVNLERPDIMEFRTDVVDTNVDTIWYQCIAWSGSMCIDSIPLDPPIYDTSYYNRGIDTAGTLVSNWEFLSAASMHPGQHDIKVIGLAEYDHGMPYTMGLLPRTNPGLLLRLMVRIYDELPSGPGEDSTVTVNISPGLSETNFSDPYGNLIGTVTSHNVCDTAYCETWDPLGDSCLTELLDTIPEVYDTMLVDSFWRYWICQEWGQDSQGGDSCLAWGNYSDPDSAVNADSISLDSIAWTIWNPETAFLTNGSLKVTVLNCTCGDTNEDGGINVGDPVFLINYIFKSGPPPAHPDCADVNNDTSVNVGDAVYLISFIFRQGPLPNCGF